MDGYTLRRSRRKTVAIRVEADGHVVVCAPLRCSTAEIELLLEKHRAWIEKQQARLHERAQRYPEPTEGERAELMRRACAEIPPLVEKYAAILGVQPTGIRITSARTRYGSCSGQNRLCFSWRLMRYPTETVEAIVIHELCHIVHKNHQKDFYSLVRAVLPDYDERVKIMRE